VFVPAPGRADTSALVTFEGGSLTDPVTGVDRVVGGARVESGAPLKGAHSALVPGASSTYLEKRFDASGDVWVSLYVRLNSLPRSDVRILLLSNDGDSVGNIFLLPNGRLRLRVASKSIGDSSPLEEGELYRISLHQRRGSGGDGLLEGFVAVGDDSFGGPFASTSSGAWTTDANRLRVGATAGGAVDLVLDDVTVSTSGEPAPTPPSTPTPPPSTPTPPPSITTPPPSITTPPPSTPTPPPSISLPPPTAPSITGFSPTSGGTGAIVTITGGGLSGATGVTFNGTGATFSVSGSTQIVALVPAGATTGAIHVETPAGPATSANVFTVNTSDVGIPGPPPADHSAPGHSHGGSTNAERLAKSREEFASDGRINCSKYPEKRIFLETQSWWMLTSSITFPSNIPSDQIPEQVGMGGHAHTATCFPADQKVSGGLMHFDVRLMLHKGNEATVNWLDIATGPSGTSVARVNFNPALRCPGARDITVNCTMWVPITLDLSNVPSGYQELRFRFNLTHPSGNRQFASTGWNAWFHGGTSSYRRAPWQEARGWWEDTDYTNARLLSPIPMEPVSGELRLLIEGAGGAVQTGLHIDGFFNANDFGQVVFETRNSYKGVQVIDTTKLSNGMHWIAVLAGEEAGKGTNTGIFQFPIIVDNR
jgi:hypothetical protein